MGLFNSRGAFNVVYQVLVFKLYGLASEVVVWALGLTGGPGVRLRVRGRWSVSGLWAVPITSCSEPLFVLSVVITFKERIPLIKFGNHRFHRIIVVTSFMDLLRFN